MLKFFLLLLLLLFLFLFFFRNSKNLVRIQKKHTLPALPYQYNALEPIISCDILECHHGKHHAAYVNAFNDAEAKLFDATNKRDFSAIQNFRQLMRFNEGGHINHSMYWESMSPCKSDPSPELCAAIDSSFKNMDSLIKMMSQMAVSIQGSGWAWLGYNPVTCQLELAKVANQDFLQETTGLIPLLPIDVWEHAYYLQYKNLRAEYVKHFWQIVNWEKVSERYACARQN